MSREHLDALTDAGTLSSIAMPDLPEGQSAVWVGEGNDAFAILVV
jgi:hypothetical protein